jgi:hypothetical protein
LKVIAARAFQGQRPWEALDIAETEGATVFALYAVTAPLS